MTDEELAALQPIKHSQGERNPFADVADTAEGFELSRRWAMLHWPEAFAEPIDTGDPFQQMEDALTIRRAGFRRIEGPHGVGFFPETAKDIDAWEQRAVAQSEAAERDVIVPPVKPITGGLTRGRVVRGD